MPQATVICHCPPDTVELRSIELREPREGELLVENLASAVSPGTETRCLSGKQAGASGRPFVPGYQAVGRILAVGPGCEHTVGETVFHSGGGDYGADLESMWGAHSSHAIVSAGGVVPVPVEAALPSSLGKLAAIAYHGLEAGDVKAGERVGLIGLGVLGQLSARLAKQRGAEVVAFERVESRVLAARADGIECHVVATSLEDAARAAGWPEREFDVLIDVTGFAPLLDEVVGLARELMPWHAPVGRPTRTIIQGSYAGNATFDYQKAFLKQMHFIVPRDNTLKDLQSVLPLIASGALDVGGVAGAPVSPRAAPEIYRELGGPNCDRLTGVFDWTQL